MIKALVDSNSKEARNIVRGIVGFGCNYADGRKNGVRYKWIFSRMIPINAIKHKIEDSFLINGIQNAKVVVHCERWQLPSISVTLTKV